MSKEETKRLNYAEGLEVFHWPEFQALAKRLGIELEQPMRVIKLCIPYDGIVSIDQEYLGQDMEASKE